MIAGYFGEHAAIRKYQRLLPKALSDRFGGSTHYTQAQVDSTVKHLRLNQRYVHFAYLLYCKADQLNDDKFSAENIESMHATIASAALGGAFSTAMHIAAGSSAGDNSDAAADLNIGSGIDGV